MIKCYFCKNKIPDDVPFRYYGGSFSMCDDCISYDDEEKEWLQKKNILVKLKLIVN